MIYLIYTSVATQPFIEGELIELLTQSKINNQSQDITGLLLYREGLFMQLLEGPQEAVWACYERIRSDPRHRDILLLQEKPLKERHFGDWAMAFQKVEVGSDEQDEQMPNEEDIAGFSPFLSQPVSRQELGTEFNEGLFLLLSFKKNVPYSKQPVSHS
jgi:hypothetical protein